MSQSKMQKHEAKPAQIRFPVIPNTILVFELRYMELKRCVPSNSATTSLGPLHDDLSGSLFYTSCILGNYCYVLMESKKTLRYDSTKPNKGGRLGRK